MASLDKSLEYIVIIHIAVPKLWVRPRMSKYNRAVQFAPFAALTGFEVLLNQVEDDIGKDISKK